MTALFRVSAPLLPLLVLVAAGSLGPAARAQAPEVAGAASAPAGGVAVPVPVPVPGIPPAAATPSAPVLRPGLWTATGAPDAADARAQALVGRMQQLLERLSPAQRQQLQAALAQQQLNLGADGRSWTLQHCLSPEQAARGEPPLDPQGRCTSQVVGRSAQALSLSFSCRQPVAEGSATLVVEDAWRYSATVALTRAGAGALLSQWRVQGRWLSDDCAGLLPASPGLSRLSQPRRAGSRPGAPAHRELRTARVRRPDKRLRRDPAACRARRRRRHGLALHMLVHRPKSQVHGGLR